MAGLGFFDNMIGKVLLVCIFIQFHYIEESECAVLKTFDRAISWQTQDVYLSNHEQHRNRREAISEGPPNFTPRRSSFDDEPPFIPKIAPPPPGSILSYDGKSVSTSIGAFSIVPKSERRTPSINRNRPQFATYRGDLPPAIPDFVPKDLPQFTSSKSVVSDFPPRFE